MNTADQGIVNLAGFTAGGSMSNAIGAGRANAESAVGADVALDPVSVSFGSVPSGSGRADTRLVSLSTLGTAATSAAVTNETCVGVNFGATLSGSTITVTMAANKGIPAGDCQGILRVFAGATEIAHAAVYALVK